MEETVFRIETGTDGKSQCIDCVGSWATAFAGDAGSSTHGGHPTSTWPSAAQPNEFLAWYHRTSASSYAPGSGFNYEDPVFPGWHTNTYTFLDANGTDITPASMARVNKFGVRKPGAVLQEALPTQGIRSVPVLSLDPTTHVGKSNGLTDGIFAGKWEAPTSGSATERGLPMTAYNCSNTEGNTVLQSGFCRADAKFSTYHHVAGQEYGGWRNTRGAGTRVYLPSALDCHDCVGTWAQSRGVHHKPKLIKHTPVTPFGETTTSNTSTSTSSSASSTTTNTTSTTTDTTTTITYFNESDNTGIT